MRRGQEGQVALEEVIVREAFGGLPPEGFENAVFDFALPACHPEEDQKDGTLCRIGEFVASYFGPDPGFDAEFFAQFPAQRRFGGFAQLDLSAGEFPLKCVWLVRAAPADQDGIAALEYAGYDCSHRLVDSLHWGCTMSPELIDHFSNPRNVGELAPPAITVEASNPVCGDILRLSVRMEHGRVSEVGYKVRGCAASIGTGSALTQLLSDRDRAGLASITAAEVEDAVGGLSNESKHAAVLCLDAVRAILKKC